MYKLLAVSVLVLAACSDSKEPTAIVRPTNPAFSAGTGAHFMSTSGSIDNLGDFVEHFREAGLGNSPATTVHIEVTGSGTATYACINGGGNHPKAANKENVNGPISGGGDFAITKNGSASGDVTVLPPPSSLVCPGGQRFVLAVVCFSNLTITDTTNDVSFTIPGTFCRTFFDLG